MSESPLSDAPPSDKVLERALRHAVQVVYRKGNLEELTVKRMRKAAEEELDLQEGFFKEPEWKDRSKAIIETEAVCCGHARNPLKFSLLSRVAIIGSPTKRCSGFVTTRVCKTNTRQANQEIQTTRPV